MQLILDWNACI